MPVKRRDAPGLALQPLEQLLQEMPDLAPAHALLGLAQARLDEGGRASAELKPGKHTVLLKARQTGFKYSTTRNLKAGDRWVVAPGVGTLTVDLVPFGSLKVSGLEVLKGYSNKSMQLWEGRYELEAENTDAKKTFTRPVVVKADAETKESFNFLPQ